MSMAPSIYAPGFSAETLFPGVEVINTDPMTHSEFRDFVTMMVIPPHCGEGGQHQEQKLGKITDEDGVVKFDRSSGDRQYPWHPDRFWHLDKIYWGEEDIFASVLHLAEAVGDPAGTSVIDTQKLLAEIESAWPGITEELRETTSIFSLSRYILEELSTHMSELQLGQLLSSHRVSSLDEFLAQQRRAYTGKDFPAIIKHPFSGQDCLMFDQLKLERFEGISVERSRELIQWILESFLDLPDDALRERDYYVRHHWQPGQVLVFPQIGTLHRAEQSPDGQEKRTMYRAFIS